MASDNTKPVDALVALKESEARLARVLQGSDQGYWDWQLPTNTFTVSPRFETMLGYEPGEMRLGPDLWGKYVHPDDLAKARHSIQELLEGRSSKHEVEIRCRAKSGEWRWILTRGAIVERDKHGAPVVMSGTHTDITERRAQEQQLREANARLERIQFALESVGTAVLWTEARNGRILSANAQAARMLGYSVDELTRLSVHDIDVGVTDQPYPQLLERIRGPGSLRFETVHRRKDGSTYPAEMSVYLLPDKGSGEEQYIAFGVDITERKRSEEALRALTERLEAQVAERTAQLTAASAAKSEFLAHMSHEIRTPMNAVINLTRLLQEEPLTPQQNELVATMDQAGQTLLQIINDILDFSKIEAGQLHLETLPFDLPELLGGIDQLLYESARAKGIALTIKSPPGFGRAVLGDSLRLKQILVNLLNNAIKFTHQGEVTLCVAVRDETSEGVRLRFEVRDTGVGIAPEAIATLFQPFTQADSGITRRFGGTGLGLAICKRLVDAMGGRIGVTSSPGAGSTFWFELPFGWAKPATPEAPVTPTQATGPRLTGMRVLAADDNQVGLLIVARILKREGATTVFAGDGQQALQLLRANPTGFDVVLMDVQMPVMDGLTATRAIRADPALAAIPVIALTAGVLEAERERARDAGVDDFLPKPIDQKQMVGILAEIHQRRTGALQAAGMPDSSSKPVPSP